MGLELSIRSDQRLIASSSQHVHDYRCSGDVPALKEVQVECKRHRVSGWLMPIGVAAGLAAAFITPVAAEGVQPVYSEGCEYAALSSATPYGGAGNSSSWTVEKVLESKTFKAGELVEFVASNGWELGFGDHASLYSNGELVASGGVGGQVVLPYLIPADGPYQFTGRFELGMPRLGNVAGNLSFTCRPPLDSDRDSVLDSVDQCPGTVLPDATTVRPGRNRYVANESGQFEVDGQLSGLTLADTRGCSAMQIVEALGLGDGHQRFGLSQGELATWIATT